MGMNFVYATDDRYAGYCGISLTSLLENNQDVSDISVYILAYRISDQNCNKLRVLCDRYGARLLMIDIEDFQDKIGFDVNTSAYNPIVLSRLFLTSYLPVNVDRVLYLDCDIIVTDSLKALFEDKIGGSDFTEYSVAMCPELYMPDDKKRNIGLDKTDTYFNAGVILVNLSRWRALNLDQSFLAYYRAKQGDLLYNDQDIINHCCRRDVLTLPQWYNTCTNLPYFPKWYLKRIQKAFCYEPSEVYSDRLRKPVIIHYQGEERPWIHGNRNFYRAFYDQYRQMSEWKSMQMVYGQEKKMRLYHLLNVITKLFPHFRKLVTDFIGIRWYQITRNKT